jgi:hypothetical protein
MRVRRFTNNIIIIGANMRMSHKISCRACGEYLSPAAICTVCQEHVIWVCPRCESMEDVTHIHGYCRIAYKKIEVKAKASS